MRIISGTHKGRQIHPPSGFSARPTTDIAREALFNVLNNEFNLKGLVVADLFGGTGSISYEFASRGAKEVYCIEKKYQHYKFIKETITNLGFNNIKLYRNDAFLAIKKLPRQQFNLVFADPPFDMKDKTRIVDQILENNILKAGTIILEHPDKESFFQHPLYRATRKYGKVNFSFFNQVAE